MKAWVISELGWEYNDNSYYQTEGCQGEPIKVYLNKDKADKAYKKANCDRMIALLGEDPASSHWCFFGLTNGTEEPGEPLTEDSLEFLKKHGLDLAGKLDWEHLTESGSAIKKLLDNLTEDQALEFYDTVGVAYFDLAEVELDDETIDARD